MFEFEACVAFLTNQTAKKLADSFNDRLSRLGITRVQWIAIYYLEKYQEMSQKELGQKMNIQASSVARLIDRMERDGYVQRVRNVSDRRVIHLSLTPKGEEFNKKLIPEGEKMSRIFSNNITEDEMTVFLQVLKKMEKNLED